MIAFESISRRVLIELNRGKRIVRQCLEIVKSEFYFIGRGKSLHVDYFCSQQNELPLPVTIIDIGGSRGQFILESIRCFPQAEIFSFEPIPHCFAELVTLSQQYTKIHPSNFALSDESGLAEFNLSSFDDSSSFQKMRDEHCEAWPHSAINKLIMVEKRRLDDLIQIEDLLGPVFVKIDVQGHELQVIRGGRKTISSSQRVMIEWNIADLYEGQPKFDEIYDEMKSMGFCLDEMISPLRHPKTGELMSVDLIFYKPVDSNRN